MSRSIVVRLTVAFVLCVLATEAIRDGPIDLSATTERVAITLAWIVGVAWMLGTRSKRID